MRRGKPVKPVRNILIWCGVLGIVLFAIFKFDAHGAVKFPVTLENCTPGTWVGMVKWEHNHNEGNFETLIDLEFKATGTKVVMLEAGNYSITHFRPPVVEMEDGIMTKLIPSSYLDYRNVMVGVNVPMVISFGCDEVEL